MIKTKTKTETRYKGASNPFLCKSGFYITELHMGDEELESTSDLAGPFKTLERAREVFKSKVTNDQFLSDYNFEIRGPKDITGSIWYAGKDRPSE